MMTAKKKVKIEKGLGFDPELDLEVGPLLQRDRRSLGRDRAPAVGSHSLQSLGKKKQEGVEILKSLLNIQKHPTYMQQKKPVYVMANEEK